ncbi:hypothetical protein [Streptomyces sp. NPDC047042]|uniref:hypothetical protein n=1 Tax=Streptomyces sp. NPDC047042 TaxID=3154807 RepID=UPI0034024F38
MSPLAYLRRMVAQGNGHHRITKPTLDAPTKSADPTDDLLRPTEAMVSDWAWCPVEATDRLHAFLTTGGRVCWTCRTVTTDPTPPGGAA